MKTNHKHYSAGAVIWIIIKYFSLVFFSFVALLPIVSCVITAFKTDAEYQSTNVMTLPESWLNFQNFIDAFNRANMGRAYLNSAIILVFVLLGSVLVGTQLAYVLNRFKFPGNGLIRSLFLFATLLPGIAMQVSVYQIMSNLGFINHLYGYIIMSMVRMLSPSTFSSSSWKTFRYRWMNPHLSTEPPILPFTGRSFFRF